MRRHYLDNIRWGSSYLLNTPLITVYRNGIYLLMFLLGYYVFANPHIEELLKKWHLPLFAGAVICGICYTFYYYGQDYTDLKCLTSPFTNFYAWLMILAILGCGKAWLNKQNEWTKFMKKRSFGIYILHYPVLILSAHLVNTYLNLPLLMNYIVLCLIEVIVILPLLELLRYIPVLRFWLLGISKKQ